jgi:hypothetical protein
MYSSTFVFESLTIQANSGGQSKICWRGGIPSGQRNFQSELFAAHQKIGVGDIRFASQRFCIKN